jgi:hypothetical protein
MTMSIRLKLPCPVLAVAVWLLVQQPCPAGAAEPDQAADTRVIQVLLLSASVESADSEQEQRLVTELGLLLDADEVIVTPLTEPDFPALSPSEQAALIEPLAQAARADATVWLADAGQGKVQLRVLEFGQTEALVSPATDTGSPSLEAELALVASELLGEAARMETDPRTETPNDETTMAEPEDEDAEPGEIVPIATPSGTWGLLISFRAGGGIGPDEPRLLLGGGLAAEYEARSGWLARVRVSGSGEPQRNVDESARIVARIDPGVAVGHAWRIAKVRLAPLAGVSVPWSLVAVPLESRDDARHSRWNVRFDVGAELTLGIGGSFGLALGAAVGINAFRDRFKRLSDNSIEAMALVEHAVWAGLLFGL